MNPRLILLVALGGLLGSLARYGLSGWATRGDLPYGTLLVNVLGSLAAAFLFFAAASRGWLSPEVRTFALIGFLGAFTTMSTFSVETIAMLEESRWVAAGGNVAANVGLSLVAAMAGRALALVVPGGP